MSGLLESGETVEILHGYYRCEPMRRGDLVAYAYMGREAPVVKQVRGLPGDSFHVEPRSEGSGWHLELNGQVLRNAQGEPYWLDRRALRMLSVYEAGYQGIIPAQTCLLLGNRAEGSMDSSRFGLVHRDGLLGRVLSPPGPRSGAHPSGDPRPHRR